MDKKELKLRMGANVRPCRQAIGYTQEELAEICNVSAAFCAQIETGRRMVSLPTLIKLADALHTSVSILIYGTTKDERAMHIMELLNEMPDQDVEYIEKSILLTKDWIAQRADSQAVNSD